LRARRELRVLVRQHLGRAPRCARPSIVEDEHVAEGREHDVDLVGREHERGVLGDVGDDRDDLSRGRRIESGGRVVEQEDVGRDDESAREPDPATHTERERARRSIVVDLGDADAQQGLSRAIERRVEMPAARRAGDVLEGALVGDERVALKGQARPSSTSVARECRPVDRDVPALYGHEAGERQQEERLARGRPAEDDERASPLQRERERPEHEPAATGHDEVCEREAGRERSGVQRFALFFADQDRHGPTPSTTTRARRVKGENAPMDPLNDLLQRVSASLEDRDIVWNLFTTVALGLTVLLVRSVVLRSLMLRAPDDPSEVRRLRALIRNVALVVMLIGAAVIWANELRTLALSLVAVAAAIVIATKELILCLSGALYRQSANLFRVGDRIEVNNVRGDVIETGLLSTTVLEVTGPGQLHAHTGRAVVVPNAFFLSHAVTNESFSSQYVLHTMEIALAKGADVARVERAFNEAIAAEVGSSLDDAREQFQRTAKEHGLERPSIDPRVWIHFIEGERVALVARFPVSVRKKGRVEQAIVRRLLPEITAPTTTSDVRANA